MHVHFMCKGKLINSILFAILLCPSIALAQGMPWEGPLNKILNSINGPVAKVLGSISILFLGFGLAFSEGGSFMRKAVWVVVGLVVAFNAVSWGIGFLGFNANGGN